MGCFGSKDSASRNASPKNSQVQITTPQKRIVLHYFDIYGRAEVIRMVLRYLRLDFKDHRFGMEEWVQMKSSTEFQICPVLEIDGKSLSQTRAIMRYLCITNGMYPTAPDQVYWCESLCDLVDDIRLPLIDAARTSDIKKLQEARASLPQRLTMVEGRLLRNKEGKGYFIGNTVTVADFMVFNMLWDILLCPDRREENEEMVPKSLKLFVGRMLENAALKGYVDGRQPRPY